MTSILFIGDVIGRPGRSFLRAVLPGLLQRRKPDLVIVNAENSAGGFGLTGKVAQEFFDLGIDVLTLGNHAFDNKEVIPLLEAGDRVIRPANFAPDAPGSGYTVVKARNGVDVAVINIIGRVFMAPVDCPFREIDFILADEDVPPTIFVDFHAEASSEKQAMGWHLDGRVSAVIGTHTHVPTADARILPQGTGYLTDAGMTGPHDSVIGMDTETVLAKFVSYKSRSFSVARTNCWLNSVWMDIGADGRCTHIESLQIREADVEGSVARDSGYFGEEEELL